MIKVLIYTRDIYRYKVGNFKKIKGIEHEIKGTEELKGSRYSYLILKKINKNEFDNRNNKEL